MSDENRFYENDAPEEQDMQPEPSQEAAGSTLEQGTPQETTAPVSQPELQPNGPPAWGAAYDAVSPASQQASADDDFYSEASSNSNPAPAPDATYAPDPNDGAQPQAMPPYQATPQQEMQSQYQDGPAQYGQQFQSQSQSPPQQQWIPNGAYDPYEAAAVPAQKRPKIAIILVAAVAVIALLAVAITAIARSGGGRDSSVEGKLYAALAKTFSGEYESRFPDFSRFSEKPTEQSVQVHLNDYADTAFDIRLKTDLAAKKIMAQFAFAADNKSVDNHLFISPDMLALYTTFLGEEQYITADPKTFAADWNNSVFGESLGEVPEWLDMGDLLNSLFEGDVTALLEEIDGTGAPQVDFGEHFVDGIQLFNEAVELKDDGTQEIRIGGKTADYDRYTYYVDGAILLKAIESMSGSMEELQDTYSGYTYGSSSGIRSMDDFTVSFYVGSGGTVSRIQVEDFRIRSTYGDSVRMDITMDIKGEERPTDEMDLSWTVDDGNGESAFHFTRSAGVTGSGVVTDYSELVYTDNWGDDYNFVLDIRWDPQASKDNFSVSFEYEDEYYEEKFGVDVVGNLMDENDQVTLLDANIKIWEEYISYYAEGSRDTLLDVDFQYGIRTIDSSDVDLDSAKGTVSLFDLTLEDLQDMLGAGYTYSFSGGTGVL